MVERFCGRPVYKLHLRHVLHVQTSGARPGPGAWSPPPFFGRWEEPPRLDEGLTIRPAAVQLLFFFSKHVHHCASQLVPSVNCIGDRASIGATPLRTALDGPQHGPRMGSSFANPATPTPCCLPSFHCPVNFRLSKAQIDRIFSDGEMGKKTLWYFHHHRFLKFTADSFRSLRKQRIL